MSDNIDAIASATIKEYIRATAKHGPMRSAHEGYAVLLEEVDELWHEIKHGTKENARKEAVQVAAMAMRLINDCYETLAEDDPKKAVIEAYDELAVQATSTGKDKRFGGIDRAQPGEVEAGG